ncbi:MAG: PHP domain-containing protein [Clostridiaceae bacterium]|nr:PHP domain-containing protein [Clostridiaceae bacterium]
MKYWVDLHIHSCLSPCADEDMTPNNIVNMSLIKGLDIIAITDHNSVSNAAACMEVGSKEGLVVVPGMELTTAEEIHLVCLFPGIDEACEFEKIVYANLPPSKNREDIFGPQIIMNSLDEVTGHEERLLSAACGLDIETALDTVRGLGGVVVPSHVDRQSFSILNTLGAIPREYGFKYLEYSRNLRLDSFLEEHSELKDYQFIRSSDAHYIVDILEQETFLDLKDKSIKSLLDTLR